MQKLKSNLIDTDNLFPSTRFSLIDRVKSNDKSYDNQQRYKGFINQCYRFLPEHLANRISKKLLVFPSVDFLLEKKHQERLEEIPPNDNHFEVEQYVPPDNSDVMEKFHARVAEFRNHYFPVVIERGIDVGNHPREGFLFDYDPFLKIIMNVNNVTVDDFECPVCYTNDHQPQIAVCGHTCCEVCWGALQFLNRFNCPICRQYIGIDLGEDESMYLFKIKLDIEPRIVSELQEDIFIDILDWFEPDPIDTFTDFFWVFDTDEFDRSCQLLSKNLKDLRDLIELRAEEIVYNEVNQDYSLYKAMEWGMDTL